MSDPDCDTLAKELAEFDVPEKRGGRSPREERVIAGFEDIQRFSEEHGRAPHHGEDRDIFERLYAVRLDRLRALEDCRMILTPLDYQGLLGANPAAAEAIGDDELLAELAEDTSADDITALRHVRTSVNKRAAEEIGQRRKCEDFGSFKPLFERVKRDLNSGARRTIPMKSLDEVKAAAIRKGDLFVIDGQVAYVADVGADFTTKYDRRDSRLRVIYDNATEIDVLQRSLQRALHRDAAARRITEPDLGPLFANAPVADDLAVGTIYVLRSKSDNPTLAAHRDVLHKIGVTGGRVETRIANASIDPTFLLAAVDVVATYTLYNINPAKLENLIHRVLDVAKLDIEILDRFGNPVRPREWFLVPLFVIDEVVERIKDGTITQYVYDPRSAGLALRQSAATH